MKDFIYDGSFEGLLTAIFYSYSYKSPVNIVKQKNFIPNFLNESIEVTTDSKKFNRVYDSILNKLSSSVLENIYLLYLSDIIGVENIILNYLKLCYKYGVNINLAKNNDTIILVDKYCRRVVNEANRFKGFIRFKEISPLNFYSSIEPDHNILPLLLNHFTNRFSDENFIIHDLKRELAIMYNKKSAIITSLKKEQANNFTKSNYDENFQSLWKTFYNSVNIKERENLKARNQHMPKRYWKHIIEVK